jgi:outer membrane immunogenic protein
MKRIFLGSLALALTSFAASAADIPVKTPLPPAAPVYNWNGFYFGAGLGFRAARVDSTVTNETFAGAPVGPFTASGMASCTNFFGACVFGERLRPDAFRGTFYGGWNWQVSPSWLIGIEGDVGLASGTHRLFGMNYPTTGIFTPINGGGQTSVIGITSNPNDAYAVKTRWDASIRGRVGWLWNPSVLLYATGGVSWLNFQTISTCNAIFDAGGAGFAIISSGQCATGTTGGVTFPGFSPAVVTNTSTRIGGTVGFGGEAKVTPNWIIRGEYRYANYGTVGFTDTRISTVATAGFAPAIPVGTALTVSHSERIQTHTATFGISYLWGGGPVVTRY